MSDSQTFFSRSQTAFEVSHRTVLAIALPMTLAYLSTPLLGVVDMAVIGRLGDAALIGGIAIGGVIFDLVFTTFNFLRSGTTGLTAQAFGARNQTEIQATFIRALLIAGLAGLGVVLLQKPLLQAGLFFIGGGPEVQNATAAYFDVRIYSAPFLLANYVVLGWFIGLGRAGTGLLLQLLLNGLNIALSIWFVIGLEWGVAGVAAATVVSEATACLAGLAAVLLINRSHDRPKLAIVFERRQILKMLSVNRDIMIRSFALLFAFAFFTARSAEQGETILAVNAILQKFVIVAAYFLDGLATAAEQLAGRAVGAKYRPAFDRSVRLTAIWSFGIAAVISCVFFAIGPQLLGFMTISPEVREAGRQYLIWAALAPLFGVLAYQMDGVYIGATWSKDMRNMMLLSLAAFVVGCLALVPFLQNHGLWLALIVFLGLRGASLAALCKSRADRTFAT
ncbi:putative MATE family efflux protein [Roseibium hamelinense]|uniref:Putative MATE family efflux protein n=1 Tax=Roseibium hamelinense TaxID=150831 RepID=A0A562SVF2_9HYPH|nr:MATE family efflux transporter [Roseibium hamelinense]MTI43047.1 MATE family efflux transporter [Roseibium hamelinense]TWI84650.1 putative MATE family efflux protein [Roseibium hamelinense]